LLFMEEEFKMNDFPAVLIGGPPHSGKSVFVYSLTHALRQKRVSHYVLRACPDGEGDWSNAADQALVRTIRVKGKFNKAYTRRVGGYLRRRHLPLLVDVGGRPTPEQQQLFAACTHAILLVGGNDAAAYGRDLATWREMMAAQGVEIIAELRSVLPGADELAAAAPLVRGTIANLERGRTAVGPVVEACVERLAALFAYDEAAVARRHLAQAPVELALDLPALARTLGSADGFWRPEQLPALVDYLPAQKPLALYGRSVNWVNGTLAMLAYPAPLWLFDARLGWVQPPRLPAAAGQSSQPGWETVVEERETFRLLTMKTHGQYLDYDDAAALPLPPIKAGEGLVLSGQIPHWLLTAVVRQLAPEHVWTAVFQPQGDGAVIVYSQDTATAVGQVIPLP
jgi:CRISPR-associated protein Csx3